MKYTYIRISALLLMLAMIACTDNEANIQKGNTFSIKIEHNVDLPYVITARDEVVFDMIISPNSENNIKDAFLRLNGNQLHTATVSSTGDITLQYTYKAMANDVGNSLIFILTVTDEDGNSIDKDFTVYVESAPAEINILLPADAPSEVKVNESVNFDITVISENDLKYIKTFLNDIEITELTREVFADPKEDIFNFVYQPTAADAEKTLLFTIEVMDALGNLVKQHYSVTVLRAEEVDIVFHQNIYIGGQQSATYGPFLNAATGSVYKIAGAAAISENIDLAIFYSGSTYRFNFAAPSASNIAQFTYTVALFGEDAISNWPVRNQTKLRKLEMTAEEFDLISSAAEIEERYTTSTNAEGESVIFNHGHILGFKTAAGKYGMFLRKRNEGDAAIGYTIIDLKVQK